MKPRIFNVFLSGILLAAWLGACTGAPRISPPTATVLPSATAIPSATATLTATATHTAAPSPTATATVTPTQTVAPAAAARTAEAAGIARPCAFVPGVSSAAKMPPEVLVAATATPTRAPSLPANSPVDAATTQKQLKVFQQIYDLVDKNYVYRDFNGLDWKATGKRYEALIKKGLKQEDFYYAMSLLVNELGDGHSAFLSPADVEAFNQQMQGKTDFVGIGAYTDLSSVPGEAVIVEVLPDSPAEESGLLPHDSIVAVDDGPVLDENHQPRTLGPEGTSLTITVQTPGQEPRKIKLVRRRITSAPKVDFCLFPGTRLGYIRWDSFLDSSLVDQTKDALKKLSASEQLEGLILDNRQNSGGLIDVLQDTLGLFTEGKQGDIVGGQRSSSFRVTPLDVNGSQWIPLVVLIGPNTQSAGEWASGLLQLTRKARLVGENTGGHVEELLGFELEDGSRLNLAIRTLQPLGLSNNVWEHQGVSPDVRVPERWDLYTEASDPAIARALEILMGK